MPGPGVKMTIFRSQQCLAPSSFHINEGHVIFEREDASRMLVRLVCCIIMSITVYCTRFKTLDDILHGV
jgi:hypothetical protein